MEFRQEGNALHISGELTDPLDTEFGSHIDLLFDQDAAILIVDLTSLSAMKAWGLSHIADAAITANRKKKQLIVRAADEVAALIHKSGLDRLLKLEDVN